MTLHEFSDRPKFYQILTQRFLDVAHQAVGTRQRCLVALSGGKTPAPFYEALCNADLPWNMIYWFLGDERWVPKDHPSSNEGMIFKTLGMNRPEFAERFATWGLGEGEIEGAARAYQEKLVAQAGEPPILDLALMGLGEDGHTASLFPGTTALAERKRFAVANHVPQSQETPDRLTLTYPVFDAARELWFLISGAEKAPMVQRLIDRDRSIPSSHINNPNQHLFWLK